MARRSAKKNGSIHFKDANKRYHNDIGPSFIITNTQYEWKTAKLNQPINVIESLTWLMEENRLIIPREFKDLTFMKGGSEFKMPNANWTLDCCIFYRQWCFRFYKSGKGITEEVFEWMKLNDIKYPFTKDDETQFKLTFF